MAWPCSICAALMMPGLGSLRLSQLAMGKTEEGKTASLCQKLFNYIRVLLKSMKELGSSWRKCSLQEHVAKASADKSLRVTNCRRGTMGAMGRGRESLPKLGPHLIRLKFGPLAELMQFIKHLMPGPQTLLAGKQQVHSQL